MKPMDPVFFPSRQAFRDWLTKHGAVTSELWIGFYKKGAGQKGIAYKEAVDESLCFGWIDGLVRRIDDARHQQRYTPRRPTSIWSAINIKRVEELTAQGLMTPAGHAAFAKRQDHRSRVYSFENQPKAFEPARAQRLEAHPKAWAFFTSQAPSYQRGVRFWVESAKKEETKDKRLNDLIAASEQGVWIKPALGNQPKSSIAAAKGIDTADPKNAAPEKPGKSAAKAAAKATAKKPTQATSVPEKPVARKPVAKKAVVKKAAATKAVVKNAAKRSPRASD